MLTPRCPHVFIEHARATAPRHKTCALYVCSPASAPRHAAHLRSCVLVEMPELARFSVTTSTRSDVARRSMAWTPCKHRAYTKELVKKREKKQR